MKAIFSQALTTIFKLNNSVLTYAGWPKEFPSCFTAALDVSEFIKLLEQKRATLPADTQVFVHIQQLDASLYPVLIKRLRAARFRPVVGEPVSLREISHD